MDKYYLIRLNEDEDGLEVREFGGKDIDKFLEEEDLNEYFGPSYFCGEFPKAKEWDREKLVLIKGKIVMPQKTEIITRWKL